MPATNVSNIKEMITELTERRVESLRRTRELAEISRIQASRATAKRR
jgi:hypothetical protein